MPNYGLVINSTYDPMSFEDYAKPFLEYAKVYKEMADEYDALEMLAGQWEKLALSEKDSEASSIYGSYASLLRQAAEDLAEKGLSVNTRGTLSQLRKDYMKKIKPMEDAYGYIQELIKQQQSIKSKSPNALFDTDFSTDVSVMDVVRDPYKSFNWLDLDDVENDAKAAATALSSRNVNITSNSELGNAFKMLVSGYITPDIVNYITNTFAAADEGDEAATAEVNSNPEIYNLYNTLKTKYGATYDANKISDSVIKGMLQGLSGHASPILTESIAGIGGGSNGSGSGNSGVKQIHLTSYVLMKNKNGSIKKLSTSGDIESLLKDTENDWQFLDKDGQRIGKDILNAKVALYPLYALQVSGDTYIVMDGNAPFKDSVGNVVTYDMGKQIFNTSKMTVSNLSKIGVITAPMTFTIKDGVVTETVPIDKIAGEITGEPVTDTSKIREIPGLEDIDTNNYMVWIEKDKDDKITSVSIWPKELVENQSGNQL